MTYVNYTYVLNHSKITTKSESNEIATLRNVLKTTELSTLISCMKCVRYKGNLLQDFSVKLFRGNKRTLKRKLTALSKCFPQISSKPSSKSSFFRNGYLSFDCYVKLCVFLGNIVLLKINLNPLLKNFIKEFF